LEGSWEGALTQRALLVEHAGSPPPRRLQAKLLRCIRAAPPFPDAHQEHPVSIDLSAVRRIAHLARIEVSEAEAPHLQDEINAILKFVEALGQVDVEGVEPMTSVLPMGLPMRDDVVTDGEIPEQVLANAPLTEDGFFLVPKVIE
jgi:aspartyl-tRNA(Asn)/glutamyl-tRNA(Gln) amidotransferase subunit C